MKYNLSAIGEYGGSNSSGKRPLNGNRFADVSFLADISVQ